jgi:5-methyltetrahydrofolate--homocysteine methyltransferase
MIDSSKWEVIEAGLQLPPGQGHRQLDLAEGGRGSASSNRPGSCRRYGAAVVVMAFDEQGQADTFDAQDPRSARAPTGSWSDEVGFPPEDIIFDPNILAVATGIDEHNNYAVDFIEATRWIKAHLPHAKV